MFHRRMTTCRYAFAVAAFVGCMGCSIDYADVSTTSPTVDQVTYCRDVMYIQPELEIVPLGYYFDAGLDDVIRFKFIAKTADPAFLFDASHVDATTFTGDFDPSALKPKAAEPWWDLSSQQLSGASFSVPPPKSKGWRGLNIAYTENDDGTLTVYVLWFET